MHERKLFSIPLTAPFPVHSFISSSLYTSIDIPPANNSLEFPYDSDTGVILRTNTTIYFYEPNGNNHNGTNVWTYNAETAKFAQVTIGGGENVPYQIYPGGYTNDPATGRMYYTGSYRNSQAGKKRKRDLEPRWDARPTIGDSAAMPENVKRELARRAPTVPWLQVLDASEGDQAAKWLTGTGNGPTLLYGVLTYVRYGKKGALIGFGGVNPDDHSQFKDPNVASYRSMTEIFVFDIDSQTWYNVTASGGTGPKDIPDGRLNFCAGVSTAPDDTSIQITIYGGYKLSNAAPTNKVHVLVLPTFQWLDVTPADQTLGDGGGYGRQTPRCLMWNDAQMIILGGIVQGNHISNHTVVNTKSCNATHPPILVLDTTTFEWKDQFNPNRSYSQPIPVYGLLGGDWRGYNAKTGPAGGFNDSALNEVFATKVARINPPTFFPALATSTPSPKPKTDVIAGAAVGGAILLALVGGLFFWWFLRRRRQDPPIIPQADGASDNGRFEKPELDSEQFKPELHGDDYKHELDGYDPMKMPPELPGEHGRMVRDGVYELDSGVRGVELDSGSPGFELPAKAMRERWEAVNRRNDVQCQTLKYSCSTANANEGIASMDVTPPGFAEIKRGVLGNSAGLIGWPRMPESRKGPRLLSSPDARAATSSSASRSTQSLDYIVRSGLAGGIAGCAAKTLIAPLDRVKILFQTSAPQFSKYAGSRFGFATAIRSIYAHDGAFGLFRGHSMTLGRVFPYAAIKFIAYEQFRAILIPTKDHETAARRALSGSLAGVTSVFFTYPLEVARVRLAFETKQNYRSSVIDIFRQIYHEQPPPKVPSPLPPSTSTTYNLARSATTVASAASAATMNTLPNTVSSPLSGIANFYRGFLPTLLGMMPYAGCSFLAHDLMGDLLRGPKLAKYCVVPNTEPVPSDQPYNHSQKTKLRTWAQLSAGGFAGLVGQTASYPLEIIRRRMQVTGAVGDGRALGLLETTRMIFMERGIRGFYVGLSIGFVKIVPMVA
ncbi:hypothetical protein Dda_6217 [Drechslerella dactyloides]|uniref:Mitochondrial thiamine pyrophosphate carrier 1 n=1 Tax=Drechslerella dactyloides TaxID=74499 RepID=A0AAD6IZN2_DREDA|nr:hypothetical protein Dda_6217 [Drechslerella dactyloides]